MGQFNYLGGDGSALLTVSDIKRQFPARDRELDLEREMGELDMLCGELDVMLVAVERQQTQLVVELLDDTQDSAENDNVRRTCRCWWAVWTVLVVVVIAAGIIANV